MSRRNNAELQEPILDSFKNAKIIGVRSGTQHKYTGVWVVDPARERTTIEFVPR